MTLVIPPEATLEDARLYRRVAASIDAVCEVPDALTITQWADRYRILPETSTAPGPYDSSVVPYHRKPQDLLGDPATDTLVLCWASQTGKSTVIENAIGYRIHRSPSPMLIVQPKIDAAESWAREKLVPMIVATPVLRERVDLRRSAATLRYKKFPGGFVFVPSAQSATELAARAAPWVACDEVDRYEHIAGEGSPVEIVARRLGATDIGQLVLTSTPRDAQSTIIWPYLEAGTFERYLLPCPYCALAQPLEWAYLRWGADPLGAQYHCRGCSRAWDERLKAELLAAGEWEPTNPNGEYPSFHLNALYSPFARSSWGALAREFLRARGKPADLQVFINTRLSELWEGDAEERPDQHVLAQRLEPLAQGIVPAGATYLTGGIDVQANRIEARLWAWDDRLESWLVDVAVFAGDPQREADTPGTVWAELDVWLRRAWPDADGVAHRRAAAFIDSGFATTQVYAFVRRRGALRVFASKGIGDAGLPICGKPSVKGSARVPLYPVGVDAAKTEFLRSQLYERVAGPGFVHLPDWLTTEELEQLVAEKRFRRVVRGRVTYEWRRVTAEAPNEALDCRILARAALELARRRRWRSRRSGALAAPAEADDTPTSAPVTPAEAPPVVPAPAPRGVGPFRPRGRGWMSSW